MPKLKRISGEKAIRRLEKLGFKRVRQRGSHVILKKQTTDEEIGCVVPLHKELAVGTLRGILKQAKLTSEEFMED
ncbi:MAG: type II toxin-antitoxin system HicA family toxin [Pseudomonadota bacterium]